MRQRFRVTLAAAARWPDADAGRNLPPFNWVRVDNRGTGSVVVSPAPVGATSVNDTLDYTCQVPAGQVRVFNVGPPRSNHDIDPVHPDPEMGASTDTWWHEIHLFSLAGTTVEIDVADYPLVDLVSSPSGTSSLIGQVRLQDGTGSALATVGVFGSSDVIGNGQNLVLGGSLGLLYDGGTSLPRARMASAINVALQSGLGVALVAPPGQWSAVSTPAAGTQASASRAAGAAGVRHMAAATTFSWGAIAAPVATLLQANVRDGATGAGTIIEGAQAAVPAAVFQGAPIPVTPNNPGTAATAMTAEFSASLANLAQGASLNGYDVS